MSNSPFIKLLAELARDGRNETVERLSSGTGIKKDRMARIRAEIVRPSFDEYALIVNHIGGKARKMKYDDIFPANLYAKQTTSSDMIADDSLQDKDQSFRHREVPNSILS